VLELACLLISTLASFPGHVVTLRSAAPAKLPCALID
jgi:hypothetical protein